MSHVRCFQWLGGVPELVVPDNLKSATSGHGHDPDVNPTYQQMLEHYNVAVCLRGHVNRKIKPKLKLAFRVVERWIMARIRHEIFYSLASLNQRIRELLERLNNKIMQKLGYSRAELFIQLDKPALKPLPEASYSYTPREESQSSCRLPRGNRQTLLLGSMFAVRPATGSMDLGELVRLFNQGRRLLCTRASVLMATVPATSTCLKLIDSMPPDARASSGMGGAHRQ